MLDYLINNINWADAESFQILLFRLVVNLIFITVLIRGIYYPINRNKEFLFSFFIFNILIFFISSLLSDIRLETGFAFGLFAIFSIIRYRTEQVPIKEMTFLFISIIVATINSTVTEDISMLEIVFANLVIISISYLLELTWKQSSRKSLVLTYGKMDLIKSGKEEELLADLRAKTGLDIDAFEIDRLNLKAKSARIRIYYK